MPKRAAGKTPDIFEVPNCDVVALGVNHQAADLTDILEARGWLNQMSPSIRAAMSDNDGRIYGIPYISYAFGLLCNTELFEAAGLTDDLGTPIFPKTWQEAAKMAVQIKEATGEAGFCLLAQDYAGAWQFINIAWNFGATDLCLIAEDGTYTANLNSDAAIEAMKFVKALKWDYGVLTEKPEEENYSTGLEHIGKGTAAMHIAANDAINIAVASGLTPNNFALGAVPAGPDGTQYSLWWQRICILSGCRSGRN